MRLFKVHLKKLATWFSTHFPSCYNDDHGTNPVIRGVLFYLVGLLLGALFWKYVLDNIGLPLSVHFVLGLGISVLLGKDCEIEICAILN